MYTAIWESAELECIVMFDDGFVALSDEKNWTLFDENGNVVENVRRITPTSDHYKTFENGQGKNVILPESSDRAFYNLIHRIIT